MAPSNEDDLDLPSTPQRTGLAHRRHHSIANDTIHDIVGGMNIPTPHSAPRPAGRSSGRHSRHATHSHFDLESTMLDNDEGMTDWSIRSAAGGASTNKHSSAMAMAQYLDNVESSDQVHDICSFQDVNLEDIDQQHGQKTKHHRHTSSDSFHSNGSNSYNTSHQGTPRRARRMYYLLPMMWKHRYPIIACVTTFLACVIVISTSVKSSMKSVNSLGNSNRKEPQQQPVIVDMDDLEEMEMVGPPLEISSDTEDDGEDEGSSSGKGTIHQPQQPPQPPSQLDENGGALILGPGGVNEEDSETPSSSSRTPCMTTAECEARADLLGFPTYEEGPFDQKGCYYEGSVVYWGTGATTTNDDEEENDLTLDELAAPLVGEDNGGNNSQKYRLFCDVDELKIAIDKVTAALAIAEGKIDVEEGDNDSGITATTVDGEDVVVFEEIQEGGGGGGGDEDGVEIVGEPLSIEEDPVEEDEDGGDGALTVGAPLQIESNPDDNIDAEWFATDNELYLSLMAEAEKLGLGPHDTAIKFCENKSKSLCNYNDYCPEGKSTRVYQGGPDGNWIYNPAESEQWAPVLAHSTQSAGDKWVQVGKIVDGGDASENFGECWTYADWINRDDADMNVEDDIEESHRRFFLCCDN
ncbi:hypothetical protein ACHAWT_000489 [Skeletonema menzelii]